MTLSEDQTRLIEDRLRLELASQLLRDVAYDSVTEYKDMATWADDRTATEGLFIGTRQQLRLWHQAAARKLRALF